MSVIRMIIRQATDEDVTGIAHVHIKTWHSTYKGILPDEYLDSLTIENRKKNWLRNLHTLHSVVYVAINNIGEIVGFIAGGPVQYWANDFQAEIYTIYILQSYQRQGIGKQLLKPIIQNLIEKKYENIIIWALQDNPYRAFYQSLGGIQVSSKEITVSGKALTEVAYGWHDIYDLLKSLEYS